MCILPRKSGIAVCACVCVWGGGGVGGGMGEVEDVWGYVGMWGEGGR